MYTGIEVHCPPAQADQQSTFESAGIVVNEIVESVQKTLEPAE